MFSITIVFGAAVPWTLLFKTPEAFTAACQICSAAPDAYSGPLNIIDDYGQQAVISRPSIQGIMFEDMSQSRLAHIERALHQDRMNIEAGEMRKADPKIAMHMRGQMQQPGVITPFGPNGAFRQ